MPGSTRTRPRLISNDASTGRNVLSAAWLTAVMTVCALVLVGIVTALLPARRAAELPPVEALRYEM